MTNIKNITSWFIVVISFLGIGYFVPGYVYSIVGWYGYKKWQHRIGTTLINESKKRQVFVKELHFKIDSFSSKFGSFKVYLEKGFRYGHHSEGVTCF